MRWPQARRSIFHVAGALLFLLLGSLPRAVLCIAGDHRAIEVVEGESCHPVHQALRGACLDSVSAVPCLGDGCPEGCSDSALGGATAIRPASADAGDFHALATVSFALGDTLGRELRQFVDLGPFTSVDSSRLRRTTVLLC